MRYRGLVLAVVVLVMIPGVAAAAMQGHAFYVQKARNLVFSDLGLGEPAQYERLVSLIRGEDYLEAAVLMEDILDAESRTSALRQASLAYLWAAGGDQGLALEIFNNVDDAPAHLQVPLARSLCLHDLGRLAEAAAVFTAVASSSSDSGESRLAAWNALVDYRGAAGSYVKRPDEGVPQLVYDYRNAYEELAGLFEWGAAEMPRERLLADLAETLGRYGLYAAAGDLWRRVLEAPLPEDAGAEELSRAYAAVKLADLSRQSGAYTSAAAWLERALELAETEELRRYAQNQLEALQTAAQGRVAEAVIRGAPESEEAARLARQRIDNLLVDENAPTPYLSAAELAFAELVDIDLGQRYLERALQENESPARVVALAGEAAYALTRVGDYEAADDLYGLALSVDPGNEPLVYAHRLNAVRLALADERLGEAVDSLYGLLGDADSGTRLEAAFILLELGRLREITFRKVGEGTGESSDLDRFDTTYRHLFVWNREEREIVGAYRLGLTDEILPADGKKGLYTSTLFRFKTEVIRGLDPAIELGRSFVVEKYQRKPLSLGLLWRGIGRFIVRNPRYCTLFGPVSISREYHGLSKNLMVAYLKENNLDPVLASKVKARNPLRSRNFGSLDRKSFRRSVRDIDDVSALISEIEREERGVPVLLRQYLKLNATLLSFNVDPAFNDSLDGLVLVDLRRTAVKVLRKYMGAEGVDRFLRHHAGGTPGDTVPNPLAAP